MYYFASDIHLGAGSAEQQRECERLFVEWLDRVSADATAIFLCGDIFDFWYEYKEVVPRGFVRTLGKIAELTDRGIRVVFMAGNHDMWIGDYFQKECGMELYTAPTTFNLGGKKVHVAHGDNLNIRGNAKLKLMNGIFRSSVVRAMFSWLIHPNFALMFGHSWSRASRKRHCDHTPDDKLRTLDFLKEYAALQYTENKDDIYVFGHLHCAHAAQDTTPQIIFMNDWSSDPHYIAISESGEAKLCSVK